MNKEWNKWLLTTTILSMAMGSTAVGAYANSTTESPMQASLVFSDQSYISSAKRAAVDEAVKNGLLSGYPDGSFRPNQLLTRQELAVLLAKAMHLEPKQNTVSSFSDIKDSWAIPYIEALVEAGLIIGDGSNTYRPSEPVTREELATVFVRAVNGVDAKGGKEALVTDSKEISPWAEKTVSLAMRLGLMNAEENAFDPRGNLERQDIAAYLLDIFKAQEQTATIDRIDGDMVVIDGKPYLISGALKDLLGDRNREALEGAVLKYKSVNHNVNDLLRIELTKSGKEGKPVELDLRNTSFKGELVIAADHIAVNGDSLTQVVLKQGAGSLDLHAKVAQVLVDTSKPVKIEGSGAWGELKISNPDTRLSLGKGVTIEKLKLPENTSADKLISNFKEVMNQISSIRTSGAQPPAVSLVNNRAPKSTRTLEDRTFMEGAAPQSISVADLFADEDGDSMTLTVYSDQASVVEAVYGNGFITLTPRRQGSSSIRVTADDGKGGIGQVVFGVAVTTATPMNHAPTVVKALSALTQAVKDGSKTVSLVGVFADEDGDKLTYSAVTSNAEVATVAVSGTDLTITPVSAGMVTITVTANDGKDGTKPTSFTVTFEAPLPENHAPVVANKISDITAGISEGSKKVSLANVFTDEDKDTLTYSAVTSNTEVATVAVSGTDLTITPVSAGMVTITVTANDGKDGTKPTSFTVTFEAPLPENHAPVVANEISDITVGISEGSKKVSLANVFTDEDKDTLTYSAVTSNTGVATVAVSGTDLTITPVTAGTVTITVTANDGKDGTKPTSFTVTFEAPLPENHAPVVANTISDITAGLAEGSKKVSLANVFTDEDKDTLTYSVASSNTSVAMVAVTGTTLTVTPVTAGTATITVTANDGNGGTKQTQFTVNIEAVAPKGLFFSELVWGSNDPFLQAIELYNPTGADIDATKVRIERSNGDNPITLENGMIASGGTFTIVESFYFGTDVPVDYNTMMNFYADDTQPVTLSLYYDNKLVDIVIFFPHQSVARVSGTVIGSATGYETVQWTNKGVDYIDDLGKFTP